MEACHDHPDEKVVSNMEYVIKIEAVICVMQYNGKQMSFCGQVMYNLYKAPLTSIFQSVQKKCLEND